MHNGLARLDAVDEHVVHAVRDGLVDAHAGGRVGLRVEVAQEHPASLLLQRGGQVHAGRGLADAALLVYDCNNFGHGSAHSLSVSVVIII